MMANVPWSWIGEGPNGRMLTSTALHRHLGFSQQIGLCDLFWCWGGEVFFREKIDVR